MSIRKRMVVYFAPFIMLACKKDVATNAACYSGTYKGTVTPVVNQVMEKPLSGHSITWLPTSGYNQLQLVNDMINTCTATVSGSSLTIPSAVIGTNRKYTFVDYGKGEFSGRTFTFEFHRDVIRTSDQVVEQSYVWKGVVERE